METPASTVMQVPASFTRRLVFGVVLVNVLVIILAGLSLYESRKHYRERAEITAQNLTHVFEQSLTSTIEKIDLTLLSVQEEVTREMSTGGIDEEKFNAFLVQNQVHMPELGSLRVADAEGLVKYGLGARTDLRINISDRKAFQDMKNGSNFALAIDPPLLSRVDKKWVIPLGRRLNKPDGSFAGVVYTVIPLDYFTKSFSGLNIGMHGSVALREVATGLIARYPIPRDEKNLPGNADASPKLQEAIREGQVNGVYVSITPIDKLERTVSFRRIPNTPLYIIVGLASVDYLAPWRREIVTTSALLVIFFLITLAMSVLLHRGWQRQVVAVDSLRDQKEFLHTILEGEPECVKVIAADGSLLQMNRAGLAILEVDSIDEINQRGPLNFVHPEYRQAFFELNQRVLHGETGVLEYKSKGKNGAERWMETHASPLRNGKGIITAVVAVTRDITERKASKEKIEFLAYHDALTMLPNRLLAKDHMGLAMSYADRAGAKAALLYLDLDNFKTINDTLGHLLGDDLLKMVATRLRECISDTDTLSRHGGDEFLIVLSDMHGPDDIISTAEKILGRMKKPYVVDDHTLLTSFSIGIAVYPDDGSDFETLLKKADTALFQAKQAGRNTYRFYAEQMNVNASEDLRMRTYLGHALETGEFILHYQPQINLTSGKVIGAEALIRLNHPELGMVPPNRFIPVAEACGLIVPIGEWVIREACRQAVAWRNAGLPELVIAVNLSSVQFQHGDLEKTVIKALAESGLDPAFLELELTESILIQDTENVLEAVNRLKALGLQLSIDDFGTGYSSLSYLKRFAVDKLKIDQSFIRNMADEPSDAAIVRAIIQIARSLNLKTIAEGVEDERSLALLNIQHCDEAQGFYFARPMPPEEFVRYLKEQQMKVGNVVQGRA
ncbi:MAG: bifunctional diguanylate cyclase/phosphodiesterase [Burkholderiaceae bacterium]